MTKNKHQIDKYVVKFDATISDVMKAIDFNGRGVVVLQRHSVFYGILTDGDVRRAILSGAKLDDPAHPHACVKPVVLYEGKYSQADLNEIFFNSLIFVVPVISESGGLVKLEFKHHEKDILQDKLQAREPTEPLEASLVVMAGGKGKRLSPFTDVLPKPLVPINGKTVVELIIEHFVSAGVSDVHMTLNFKKEVIKAYMQTASRNYKLKFWEEEGATGTAGSLSMLDGAVKKDVFITNCDVIVNVDYPAALKLHQEMQSAMTVITAVSHHQIPYGVVDIGEFGNITRITEKPETAVNVNTGVYILAADVLSMVPQNSYFDMPQLIELLLKKELPVRAYPVSAANYSDIGQWPEYKQTLEKFSMLSLN